MNPWFLDNGSANVGVCVCPHCGRDLPASDVNAETDAAKCHECGLEFRLSQIMAGFPAYSFDLNQPPEGIAYQLTSEGFVARAKLRPPELMFLVPVTVSAILILATLFGKPAAVGWMSPVLITLSLTIFILLRTNGHVEVGAWGQQGCISVRSFGPIRKVHRFRWSEVELVYYAIVHYIYKHRGGVQTSIARDVITVTFVADSRRKLIFGGDLAPEQLGFLLSAIRAHRRRLRAARVS